MALSNAAKAKQLEIYLALDAMDVAATALGEEHGAAMTALQATHKTAITNLVKDFKQLGGTSADFPLKVKQHLGIFDG